MPRRRALPAGASDAPRLPENLSATGIENSLKEATLFFIATAGKEKLQLFVSSIRAWISNLYSQTHKNCVECKEKATSSSI